MTIPAFAIMTTTTSVTNITATVTDMAETVTLKTLLSSRKTQKEPPQKSHKTYLKKSQIKFGKQGMKGEYDRQGLTWRCMKNKYERLLSDGTRMHYGWKEP